MLCLAPCRTRSSRPSSRCPGLLSHPLTNNPLPLPAPQFVGVKLRGSFCPTWAYEKVPNPVNPPNLHQAMLARRLGTTARKP